MRASVVCLLLIIIDATQGAILSVSKSQLKCGSAALKDCATKVTNATTFTQCVEECKDAKASVTLEAKISVLARICGVGDDLQKTGVKMSQVKTELTTLVGPKYAAQLGDEVAVSQITMLVTKKGTCNSANKVKFVSLPEVPADCLTANFADGKPLGESETFLKADITDAETKKVKFDGAIGAEGQGLCKVNVATSSTGGVTVVLSVDASTEQSSTSAVGRATAAFGAGGVILPIATAGLLILPFLNF